MAQIPRLEVYRAITETGLIPLFYQGDVEIAAELALACARGGAQVVEFTNRGEMAYPVFTELARRLARAAPSPTAAPARRVILGVGSIVDAPTAALFIAAGANFIVGPNLNPEISRLCNRRKIAYVPGASTENEISQAEELGAEIVKVFPGEVLGPKFIRAVMAPCPWHRLLPTGGVDATEASVTEWIRAGAAAVGMGSKLITAEDVKARAFDSISERVDQVLRWIRAARELAA